MFFVLVFAGRVFGPGFGFTLGCTSLFASALLTGGVGPWMPYQMFGCAWVGLFAGLLPAAAGPARDRDARRLRRVRRVPLRVPAQPPFWPFSVDPGSSISYLPGAPFTEQWHRYLVFDATTSLGWDTGRAVTDLICILLLGPAVLATLRRAARRANFYPAVTFAPHRDEPAEPSGPNPRRIRHRPLPPPR